MAEIVFFELEPWERDWLAARPGVAGAELVLEPLTPESPGLTSDCRVLSGFIRSRVTPEVLDKLPSLGLVATRSTGYDHIDTSACRERGILVCNVPHYGEHTVAEHTFGLMLSLSRKIHHAYVRTSRHDFSLAGLRGFDLRGKTLGVLGTGNIGIRVIQIARGFGMQVLAWDAREQPLLADLLGFRYVTLDELLPASDVLSLHVPLLPSTHHLIGREALAKIKPGALLINTSRGALVDTEALIAALDSGRLSGAGLDVLEGEELLGEESRMLAGDLPSERLRTLLQDYDLLHRENVIVTPHAAFYSKEAQERILQTTVENITGFLEGRPQNVVGA